MHSATAELTQELSWVGSGQSADWLGRIGSHKMDPWTTLSDKSHDLTHVVHDVKAAPTVPHRQTRDIITTRVQSLITRRTGNMVTRRTNPAAVCHAMFMASITTSARNQFSHCSCQLIFTARNSPHYCNHLFQPLIRLAEERPPGHLSTGQQEGGRWSRMCCIERALPMTLRNKQK